MNLISATSGPEPIGILLQTWRTARGLSLGALARQAQLSKSTLSRWEAGLRQPSLSELDAVLNALQATATQRNAALAGVQAPRAVQAIRQGNKEARTSAPPIAGDLLRAMRLRNGKTLAETARSVGVAHSTLLRWERGESFPSNEHLHALCFALGAQAPEAAALTVGSGPWLAPEWTVSTDPEVASEAPSDRMHLIGRRLDGIAYRHEWTPESESLRDLGFLALEAAVWPLVHNDSDTIAARSARHLLAHIYARHAQYLSDKAHWQQAEEMARLSLETAGPLFPEPGEQTRLQLTAWPVAIIVSVRSTIRQAGIPAARRRHAAVRGIRKLTDWLDRKPGRPGYHAWQMSEIADLYLLCGDGEQALRASEKACRLVEEAPRVMGIEVILRRRDHAQMLTRVNRADEALALLESASGWRGQPVHQANEDLIWAEALRASGEISRAQQRLQSAQSLIQTNRLDSLHSRASALALTL